MLFGAQNGIPIFQRKTENQGYDDDDIIHALGQMLIQGANISIRCHC